MDALDKLTVRYMGSSLGPFLPDIYIGCIDTLARAASSKEILYKKYVENVLVKTPNLDKADNTFNQFQQVRRIFH